MKQRGLDGSNMVFGVMDGLPGLEKVFREEFPKAKVQRCQHNLPSAVKCLERSIGACLTFFICPEEAWISLRTTNIIERLNKELKRRTKPMEIVAGENACYTL
ncbi:MAG: transposase, partial [Thermodesulfobacteriota bacterium]|nr:transposase [Thermodesulfobacteriota bacterium]